MWRYLVGGVAALLMVAAGVMLFKPRAKADTALGFLKSTLGLADYFGAHAASTTGIA